MVPPGIGATKHLESPDQWGAPQRTSLIAPNPNCYDDVVDPPRSTVHYRKEHFATVHFRIRPALVPSCPPGCIYGVSLERFIY